MAYAIPDGRVAMAATLYTGNGTAQTVNNAVNGISFTPDMVWNKGRSVAYNHNLVDVIRGNSNVIFSNTSDAEQNPGAQLDITTNGFISTYRLANLSNNQSAATYVGWQWKAGGTAVSNTSGSITSSVSANPTAGFSVVTWTGTGVAATVGHGLGAVPAMIIVKKRSGARSWIIWHKSFGTSASGASSFMYLDSTGALGSLGTADFWNSTASTSTLLHIGADNNDASATYVAYVWASVAGYSAFGSYTGNGSADGPFIYTGFRPRWLMIKNITNATYGDWQIYDASRSTYNLTALLLQPNTGTAEYDGSGSGIGFDLVSNGVKVRTSNASRNNSGDTFVYAAFAENPLKYSNAR